MFSWTVFSQSINQTKHWGGHQGKKHFLRSCRDSGTVGSHRSPAETLSLGVGLWLFLKKSDAGRWQTSLISWNSSSCYWNNANLGTNKRICFIHPTYCSYSSVPAPQTVSKDTQDTGFHVIWLVLLQTEEWRLERRCMWCQQTMWKRWTSVGLFFPALQTWTCVELCKPGAAGASPRSQERAGEEPAGIQAQASEWGTFLTLGWDVLMVWWQQLLFSMLRMPDKPAVCRARLSTALQDSHSISF